MRKVSPRVLARAPAAARIATPIARTTAPWKSGWNTSTVFGRIASETISGTARMIDMIAAVTTSGCSLTPFRAGICLRTRGQFPHTKVNTFSDSLMDEAIGR